MNRAQRYRLAEAIARTVTSDDRQTSEYDIYIRAFGVEAPFHWEHFGSSNFSYVLGTLQERADEASLLEMAEDLGISIGGLTQLSAPQMWRNERGVRLFISHVSGEKVKASRLRGCLRPYGVSGFVAHEDIEPTLVWQSEIEKALFTMDAFLSIHTAGFAASVWTQQEIGFAVARRVPTIALMMGEVPQGFIAAKQGLLRYEETAEMIAEKVVALLRREPSVAHRFPERPRYRYG